MKYTIELIDHPSLDEAKVEAAGFSEEGSLTVFYTESGGIGASRKKVFAVPTRMIASIDSRNQ